MQALCATRAVSRTDPPQGDGVAPDIGATPVKMERMDHSSAPAFLRRLISSRAMPAARIMT